MKIDFSTGNKFISYLFNRYYYNICHQCLKKATELTKPEGEKIIDNEEIKYKIEYFSESNEHWFSLYPVTNNKNVALKNFEEASIMKGYSDLDIKLIEHSSKILKERIVK